MKSLSEIETLSKRSSRAIGFSWGVAEEIGKNIRILEMFGIDGISNLNNYFKARKNKKFESLNFATHENKDSKLEYCPIISGLNFLDQIRTLESTGELKFKKLAYPLLFLPFVSRASEVVGKKLKLSIDNEIFLLNYNVSIFSNYMDKKTIEVGENILINFKENIDSFNQDEWKQLYRLAETTFVEETDSLKEGAAGAGLTDND